MKPKTPHNYLLLSILESIQDNLPAHRPKHEGSEDQPYCYLRNITLMILEKRTAHREIDAQVP
jgi:hypothetical protein